ncbi:MAG: hypothetical protein J6Y94_03250 [Bacteriovoracaceae bacterium]|nr:hypothetical protein [Bacteriovoracaceae bacterium]
MRKLSALFSFILLSLSDASSVWACADNLLPQPPSAASSVKDVSFHPVRRNFQFKLSYYSSKDPRYDAEVLAELKFSPKKEGERWFLLKMPEVLVPSYRETYHGSKFGGYRPLIYNDFYLYVERNNGDSSLPKHFVEGIFKKTSSANKDQESQGEAFPLVSLAMADPDRIASAQIWDAIRDYLRENYSITRVEEPQHIKIANEQGGPDNYIVGGLDAKSIGDLILLSEGVPRRLIKENRYYFFNHDNDVVGYIDEGSAYGYRYWRPIKIKNLQKDLGQPQRYFNPEDDYTALQAAQGLLENVPLHYRLAKEFYRTQATAAEIEQLSAEERKARQMAERLLNENDQQPLTDEEAYQLFQDAISLSVFHRLHEKVRHKEVILESNELKKYTQVIKGKVSVPRRSAAHQETYLFLAYQRGAYVHPIAVFHENEHILGHFQYLMAYLPRLQQNDAAVKKFFQNYIYGGLIDVSFDAQNNIVQLDLPIEGNGYLAPNGTKKRLNKLSKGQQEKLADVLRAVFTKEARK